MKYIDGFRDKDAAQAIRRKLAELGDGLEAGRSVNVMEVCGSHTMAIARYGIRSMLPPNVCLLSGPGCPVCVTAPGYVDAAVELARRGCRIVTFGDMLHVPGSDTTLAECRAEGAEIHVSYSPAGAVELASEDPGRPVVFLAIGFETTLAAVVNLVPMARARGLTNLSLLTAFKVIPPALAVLMADPELKIDAFLCPAHVSAIIGADAYIPFVGPSGVPCVVAGFEPLDILYGLEGVLEQVLAGEARVDNQYNRVVRPEGNLKAQELIGRYLEPVDAHWRGIGELPGSGLGLRADFSAFDACHAHGIEIGPGREHPGCRCGDVIKGKMQPDDCPLFGTACRPDSAVGPCMVSSEGSCAAHFKYCRL